MRLLCYLVMFNNRITSFLTLGTNSLSCILMICMFYAFSLSINSTLSVALFGLCLTILIPIVGSQNAILLEEKEKNEKELQSQIVLEAEEFRKAFFEKRNLNIETGKGQNREREKVSNIAHAHVLCLHIIFLFPIFTPPFSPCFHLLSAFPK